MDRIPEPELMDEAVQVQAYAAADFSLTDQDCVARVLALALPSDARIADLGCGPGNICLPLAEALPAAELVGIDGSAAMLAIAAERARRFGDRLHFLPLDLADPALARPPLAGSFTAVVSNSVLHHLHDPQVFWRAVRSLAAPGAWVYVRDLRRPESPAALEALVARETAGAPAVLQRDYRASLHAAFRIAEVEQQLRLAGLHACQVQPLADRYLEVWGRLKASHDGGTTPPVPQ